MFRILNKNKGFTLIEVMIVIAIIGILSAIFILNYQSFRRQLALKRSAVKLAQDIRRVQEMAMAAEECLKCGGGVPSRGYGIYLRKVPPSKIHTSYILFANEKDTDENYFYYDQGEDTTIEVISLEPGVKIKNINFPHLNIVFTPPDPTVFIGKEGEDEDLAIITISLIEDDDKTETIEVNKAGLVSVK